MMFVRFDVAWPWPKSYGQGSQTDYIEFDKKITENKAFSFQVSKSCNFHTLFSIDLDTQWVGQDHGGIKFGLTLGRYFLVANLYDIRHWNWDEARWCTEQEMIDDGF